MTSASELFHTRRYRFNNRNTAVDDDDVTPFHSSDSSFSSHQRRPAIRRHSHNYNNLQNSRRDYRHDLDGSEYAPRQFHRHRLDYPEHEAVQPEQGHSQSPSAGSILNSRSIQRRTSTESYTLPGSVLLARQRLVERLRGVSVSGNSLIGSQNNSLEIRNASLQEMASESGQALLPTRNHPSGLAQDAINCLKLEVFKTKTDKMKAASSSECTICLEGFQDGNKVIRLHCAHRFHPCCLFPWVRVCGACPNCRKPILVNVPMN